MRNKIVCLICSFTFLVFSCTDYDLDRVQFTKVITVGILEVGPTYAFILGDVENNRSSGILESGFVLSSIARDDSSLQIDKTSVEKILSTSQGSMDGNSAFGARISDLISGAEYFFRSYAILEGEELPAYGIIESFTTLLLDIQIESIERSMPGCETEAIIDLRVTFTGSISSEVQIGIVWRNGVLTTPTLEDNIVLGDQINSDGSAQLQMPVNCNQPYSIRAFIQLPDLEPKFSSTAEFSSQTGGVWVPIGNMPQEYERVNCASAFSSDRHGYVIVQEKNLTTQNLWKFDPATFRWEELNQPPFSQQCNDLKPVSNDLLLRNNSGFGLFEYNEDRDEWTSLGEFFESITTGWVHNGQVYGIGGGGGVFVIPLTNPNPDGATILDDFPGEPIFTSSSFILEGFGYVGLGQKTFEAGISNEFYAFNFLRRSWMPVASFPEFISSSSAFSMNDKGYILTGVDENQNAHPGFWEYDPVSDQWTRLADFGRGDGNADVGFSINGIAYGGLGISKDGVERLEFWKYVPELE